MEVTNLDRVPAFITKDGSEIRELLAHRNSSIRNQSLAEARLPVGAATQEHYHPQTEEIYFITHGTGRMRIAGEVREVGWVMPSPFSPASATNSGTPARSRSACSAAAPQPMNTRTRLSRNLSGLLAGLPRSPR
jgi:hypothetical protein